MQRIRPIVPGAVSFCILAGAVLAQFESEAGPAGYLVRPLLVAGALALVVGLVSSLARRYAVLVAASTSALIVALRPITILACLIVAAVMVVARIRQRPIDLRRPVLVGAVVFLTVGIVQTIPLRSVSSAVAPTKDIDGPPLFAVLLDGYPRADTLADLGVDIAPFISELETRGFDHYPDARSNYGWTHHTLTEILAGPVETEDKYGTGDERRAIRESWRLPDDFVTISPPAGHVTIPQATDIGPGGLNRFDVNLVGNSLLGRLPGAGDLVMEGLRGRLERSLDTLASTDQRRVFAHLLAPHTPFLYRSDGSPLPPPGCWPAECGIFDIMTERLGISVREWADGTAGYLGYLNRRLIETVDGILTRHPDAVIVLFSDHGGRFSLDEPDEWFRTFLAARTPERPELFAATPEPGVVLSLVLEGI